MKISVRKFASIQETVEECSRKGGGEVIIPKGEWKTGPIHLKSKISLILEEGRLF